MEARLVVAAVVAAASLSLGASYRTQNFLVTAATPELAQEICQQAETYRRDLAIEWLGAELPPWGEPCPISVRAHPQLGAGGATSFSFHTGYPTDWTMSIQGSRERLLDSVLPHEVTHTIFATHFRRPLPRWADEGACTTVEHESEKAKQKQFLIEFLTTRRGIAFNQMFAMTEYPPDVMPLYSQGFSLARYLIAQGGKRKFVDYIGEGMRTSNWPDATRRYYGYRDLSDLQLTWLEWVRQGSPELTAQERDSAIAADDSRTPEVRLQSPDESSSQDRSLKSASAPASPIAPAAALAPVPQSTYSDIAGDEPERLADASDARPLAEAFPVAPSANDSAPAEDGSWYAQTRDAAKAQRRTIARAGYTPGSIAEADFNRLYDASASERILEWQRR